MGVHRDLIPGGERQVQPQELPGADIACIAQTQGESTALANLGIQLAALCPQTLSGTFPAQSWTDDGSVYTQSLPPTALQIVTGSEAVTLEESTEAYIDLDMREATAEDGISLQDTWALVGRVSVDKAGVHAVCYGQAPAMDLPFLLRVVKKRSLAAGGDSKTIRRPMVRILRSGNADQ